MAIVQIYWCHNDVKFYNKYRKNLGKKPNQDYDKL